MLAVKYITSILLLFLAFNVSAQNGVATIASTESPIVLDISEGTLYEKWEIDLSDLDFDEEADAKYYLDMCVDNILRFDLNWEDREAILVLSLSLMPDWNIDDWYTYAHNKMGN